MIAKEQYLEALTIVETYHKQLNIPVVSNSLQAMIVLKEYYEAIARTYKGGCYNHRQAEANRKIKVLEDKISEISDNYC